MPRAAKTPVTARASATSRYGRENAGKLRWLRKSIRVSRRGFNNALRGFYQAPSFANQPIHTGGFLRLTCRRRSMWMGTAMSAWLPQAESWSIFARLKISAAHDPGEREPLRVYWYERLLNPSTHSVDGVRHVIDYGGRTGVGGLRSASRISMETEIPISQWAAKADSSCLRTRRSQNKLLGRRRYACPIVHPGKSLSDCPRKPSAPRLSPSASHPKQGTLPLRHNHPERPRDQAGCPP